jgi:SAM-dependent methyltransferase
MSISPTVQVQEVNWAGWLQRWDAQQSLYMTTREERFGVMLDALEGTVVAEAAQSGDGRIVALDIACGPGAISQRLLARFPSAQSFAVDLDPVLLAIGQGALGTLDGRLTWLEEDLNDGVWVERLAERLGGRQLDAVLSTTALHWVSPGTLARVYRELGQLMRPGGVFLNGDHMAYSPDRPTIRDLAMGTRERRRTETTEAKPNAETWEGWWQAVAAEPALAELHAERERRFAWRDHKWARAGYDFQVAALKDAGFREVDTIWQRYDNRILMAVR